MPQMREIKTCDRCRHFKRRCDLIKPSCTRCAEAGVRCSFDIDSVAILNQPLPSTSAPSMDQDLAALSLIGSSQSSHIDEYATETTRRPSVQSGLISPSASTQSPESSHSQGAPPVQAQPHSDPPDLPGPTTQDDNQKVVRKRKRNLLSCMRCHRLKVKCDKELPCGRCKSSGNARDCYYSFNKGPNGGKFACPTPGNNQKTTDQSSQMPPWEITHKVRGSSHWRELMAKITALTTMENSPLDACLESVVTNACLAKFSLPSNFPFGTPSAAKYYSKEAIVKLVASEQANVPAYVKRYCEKLEVVNPILDIDVFNAEIERYWLDPASTGLLWISKFLMVIGLGCFMTGPDNPPIATELMIAAEACLMQTPFMFRPELDTVRTLTLMTVAKQTCNATCWSMDSAYSLLGVLVRVCYILGLPQEKMDRTETVGDTAEKKLRGKMWLTVLYLDIKVSMSTGMPPLTRASELGSIRDMAQRNESESLHTILIQALPIILHVLSQVNAQGDPLSYQDVLLHNAQLRGLMSQATQACSPELQQITFDIFMRRCLMVMHRPFALHPDGPTLFSESYWASLECAIALLIHYRELWGADPSERHDLVGRPFALDIFSATLTTTAHMLRADAPFSEAAAAGCQIPPKQLILDMLENCVDIWEVEQETSVCWRTGYDIMRALLVILDTQVGPGLQRLSAEGVQVA